MEIERKYKINKMPNDLDQYQVKKIEQGYLCIEPVVRIRRSNDEYFLTCKTKREKEEKQLAICNDEYEIYLTKEAYFHMKQKIDGYLIEKKRYLIPLENGLLAELDVFYGNLKGLCFVEVEFPDIKAANDFQPPCWFGEDVSFHPQYFNHYLSGLPSITKMQDSL